MFDYDKYYAEGFHASILGYGYDESPYLLFTDEDVAWCEGWEGLNGFPEELKDKK